VALWYVGRCVAFVALQKATDREGAGAATTFHVEARTLRGRPAIPTKNPVKIPIQRIVEIGQNSLFSRSDKPTSTKNYADSKNDLKTLYIISEGSKILIEVLRKMNIQILNCIGKVA
jgi:flagellar basal body rod protein FlgF